MSERRTTTRRTRVVIARMEKPSRWWRRYRWTVEQLYPGLGIDDWRLERSGWTLTYQGARTEAYRAARAWTSFRPEREESVLIQQSSYVPEEREQLPLAPVLLDENRRDGP